jgi:hypothetical protein
VIAHADDKPDKQAAKQHYMDAVAAEKSGDYAKAVTEYAAAYDIMKDPVLFYKIAKAYEESGDKQAALVYYRRYVNEVPTAKDRDDVKKHIAELEGAGKQPDKQPDKGGGDNGVLAPPDDGGKDNHGKDSGGDGVLAPPDDGGKVGNGGDKKEKPPAFMDQPARWQRTAAWISVGLAAVALTSGALFGEEAHSRQQDLQRLIDGRTMANLPDEYASVKRDYENAKSEGASFQNYAIISFAACGVAAIAAATFFYLDSRRPAAHETEGRAGHHRFVQITPWIAPRGNDTSAGLAAGWEF